MASSDERRARSWERYWALLNRFDPDARSPIDLHVDRLLRMPPGARWLNAGCGRYWIPQWRRDEAEHLLAHAVGCDLDLEALRTRRDGADVCGATLERLPFRDTSFDYVSSVMVFEHLDEPASSVAELVRVVRKGGRILVHTVNARHYTAWLARLTPYRFHRWIVARIEGRPPEDVYPTRYRANTERRLRTLFEEAGCERVWGGEVADLPIHVPYPGAFWIGLGWGLLERRLARLPLVRSPMRANLLMEFQRT